MERHQPPHIWPRPFVPGGGMSPPVIGTTPPCVRPHVRFRSATTDIRDASGHLLDIARDAATLQRYCGAPNATVRRDRYGNVSVVILQARGDDSALTSQGGSASKTTYVEAVPGGDHLWHIHQHRDPKGWRT